MAKRIKINQLRSIVEQIVIEESRKMLKEGPGAGVDFDFSEVDFDIELPEAPEDPYGPIRVELTGKLRLDSYYDTSFVESSTYPIGVIMIDQEDVINELDLEGTPTIESMWIPNEHTKLKAMYGGGYTRAGFGDGMELEMTFGVEGSEEYIDEDGDEMDRHFLEYPTLTVYVKFNEAVKFAYDVLDEPDRYEDDEYIDDDDRTFYT